MTTERPLYYDMDANPISHDEWVHLFERFSDRQIGDTNLPWWLTSPGGVRVSTVWIGLDHLLGGSPPLIFETMIFGGDADDFQMRYPTKEAAAYGHQRAIWVALLPTVAKWLGFL